MDAGLDDNLTPQDAPEPTDMPMAPTPPELPPATEYDQLKVVIDGYLEQFGEWASDYAEQIRDVNLDNAVDIAALRQDVEDLSTATPKDDGMALLDRLRVDMPTLGPPVADRVVGGEGLSIASVPGVDIAMVERGGGAPFAAMSSEMMWGMATAPEVRTESGTAAPAHIMGNPAYVYLWPSDSDGESNATAPALTGDTADQFIKAYWRGDYRTVNIRGTNVVSYVESDGKYWIEGDWADRPINSLDFKDSAVSDERGWYHCDGRSGSNAPLRASTDLEDTGTAYNLPDYRQLYLVLSGTSGTLPTSPPPNYVRPSVGSAGDVADTIASLMAPVDQYDISGLYGVYLQGMKRIN